MNNEGLKYIFSDSACLTPKQMKRYVLGDMANEESYAAELHLNSCPFCNEAVEGLFEQQEGGTAMVTELNADFLKEHFSFDTPQVHLNSMVPAQPIAQAPVKRRRKLRTQPIWRPSGIAAVLLLGFVLFWYVNKYRHGASFTRPIAQVQTAPGQTEAAPADDQQQAAVMEPVNTQPSVATQGPSLNSVNGNEPPPQAPSQPVILSGNNNAKDNLENADKAAVAKEKADTEENKAQKEAAVVTAYKVPLIDNNASAPRANTEEIEKMPSRTTADVAETTTSSFKKKAEVKAVSATSADDLYDNGKYSAALKVYRQQMNGGDKSDRQYASIQAARCYLALGNENEAVQILQSLVNEGGPQKHAAKRMLKKLSKDKSESE